MNQTIKITGEVLIELRDASGALKDRRLNKNLVVTSGKNALAAWLAAASQSAAFMPYVALGTGTNAPTTGDTTLQTEFVGGGYGRVAGAETSTTNVLQNVASFGPGNGTGAVTEAALFNASTVGTMFARQTFSVINKLAGDTLQVTWSVTFS